MSYYIAIDRFGNLDLCHYGIKGQKWGVRNEEDPIGLSPSSAAITKYQAQGRKRTQQLKGGTYSYSMPKRESNTTASVQTADISTKNAVEVSKAARSMPISQVELDNPAISKEDDDAATKIQDASTAYQIALMKMQLLARICQSNGISPTASSEYLEARKEVVKAKYKLDTLKLDQQKQVAENPPTYAEQKKNADSEAKKKLADDKEKEKTGTDLDAIYKKQRKTLKSYGA